MNKDLYLFVLDFSSGRVHRYELNGITDSGIIEGFIIGKGHSLSNCEWMTTENPELEY
jgi:hypothetical protein